MLFLVAWTEASKVKIQIGLWPLSKSVILMSSGMVNQMEKMIHEKYHTCDVQLIYRGTRDGLTGSAFNSLVKDKGSTLSILRSTKNNIFGGFTPVPWKCAHSSDPSRETFLFTLKNPWNGEPLKFPCKNSGGNIVYSNTNEGPSFADTKFRCYIPNMNWCWEESNFDLSAVPASFKNNCNLFDGQCQISLDEVEVFLFKIK